MHTPLMVALLVLKATRGVGRADCGTEVELGLGDVLAVVGDSRRNYVLICHSLDVPRPARILGVLQRQEYVGEFDYHLNPAVIE